MREGGEVIPKKGARIIWTNDNEYLLLTSFTKESQRLISVYNSQDLKRLTQVTIREEVTLYSRLSQVSLDTSPAILTPFYDEDSNTVFLSGKGETTLHAYEIATDAPHLHVLSSYKSSNGSQGYAFIRNKSAMNVRDIEFARSYRYANVSPGSVLDVTDN